MSFAKSIKVHHLRYNISILHAKTTSAQHRQARICAEDVRGEEWRNGGGAEIVNVLQYDYPNFRIEYKVRSL